MGITNKENEALNGHDATRPSELLGRRFLVPDEHIPTVPSAIAQERRESRERVQYIARFLTGRDASWRAQQKAEIEQQTRKKRRRAR